MALTPELNTKLDELAHQHSLSRPAVDALLSAVAVGDGKMAQFNHPDLGGSGQWMAGGMTMVGDMFNHSLRARVAAVCEILTGVIGQLPSETSTTTWQSFSSATAWWSKELGTPAQTGGQNASRYAIFPEARRIAVLENGQCNVYDTLDYTITGVSQQQGNAANMTLGTNRGPVAITTLPLIMTTKSGTEQSEASQSSFHSFASSTSGTSADKHEGDGSRHAGQEYTGQAKPKSASATANSTESESILRTIERLAELRDKNIITEEEFSAKKADLLLRL